MANNSRKNNRGQSGRTANRREDDERSQRAQERGERAQQGRGREVEGRGGSRAGSAGGRNRKSNER